MEEDDIGYWRRNFSRFPGVYHLFAQSRGARPSAAQLEGEFSVAGNVVPARRSKTTTATAQALLTIRTYNLDRLDFDKLVSKLPPLGRRLVSTDGATAAQEVAVDDGSNEMDETTMHIMESTTLPGGSDPPLFV